MSRFSFSFIATAILFFFSGTTNGQSSFSFSNRVLSTIVADEALGGNAFVASCQNTLATEAVRVEFANMIWTMRSDFANSLCGVSCYTQLANTLQRDWPLHYQELHGIAQCISNNPTYQGLIPWDLAFEGFSVSAIQNELAAYAYTEEVARAEKVVPDNVTCGLEQLWPLTCPFGATGSKKRSVNGFVDVVPPHSAAVDNLKKNYDPLIEKIQKKIRATTTAGLELELLSEFEKILSEFHSPYNPKKDNLACSAVLVCGLDGKVGFGRNFDLEINGLMRDAATYLRHINSNTNTYLFTSIESASGIGGVSTGANSLISVAINSRVYQRPIAAILADLQTGFSGQVPTAPIGLYLRYLLENGFTYSQAVTQLTTRYFPIAAYITISGPGVAEGAVVEISGPLMSWGNIRRIACDDTAFYLIVTNFENDTDAVSSPWQDTRWDKIEATLLAQGRSTYNDVTSATASNAMYNVMSIMSDCTSFPSERCCRRGSLVKGRTVTSSFNVEAFGNYTWVYARYYS
jgi:hypothetical protein